MGYDFVEPGQRVEVLAFDHEKRPPEKHWMPGTVAKVLGHFLVVRLDDGETIEIDRRLLGYRP